MLQILVIMVFFATFHSTSRAEQSGAKLSTIPWRCNRKMNSSVSRDSDSSVTAFRGPCGLLCGFGGCANGSVVIWAKELMAAVPLPRLTNPSTAQKMKKNGKLRPRWPTHTHTASYTYTDAEHVAGSRSLRAPTNGCGCGCGWWMVDGGWRLADGGCGCCERTRICWQSHWVNVSLGLVANAFAMLCNKLSECRCPFAASIQQQQEQARQQHSGPSSASAIILKLALSRLALLG